MVAMGGGWVALLQLEHSHRIGAPALIVEARCRQSRAPSRNPGIREEMHSDPIYPRADIAPCAQLKRYVGT